MIGTSLLHYEITAKLGEGGMGEVYRATDTKLGREVAIKLLPEAFVDDPERLARFEREAQLLASLNHPNVAAIYGLEEDAGRRFLVLELVEGQELAERLAAGPVPLEAALEIARQVAEGLEAAHERGIVHRDLKPANLKLTGEGASVKILDLGLAKPQAGPGGVSPDLTSSPTLTARMTQAGMILGTAAYMSPEQAAGYEADRRSDVWSFGVVLYEMLAGRRLFEGESVSHVLASVLKDEPDLSALPVATPPAVRRLVGRCLRKKPRERLQAIGDARLVLEEVLGGRAEEPAPPAPVEAARVPPWRRALPWAALAAMTVVAAVAVLTGRSAEREAPPPRSVEIPMPEEVPPWLTPALSPDGRWIALAEGAAFQVGESLYLRSLDSFETEKVEGTEGAYLPFWSPDSRQVGYFASGELRQLELATRTSRTICTCAPWGRGGAWAEGGQILFAPSANSGIHEIAVEGGDPVTVTRVDPGLPDGSHRYPALLPDGRHFLYTVWSNNAEAMGESGGIYVARRDGGGSRRILRDASQALVFGPDRLLLQRGGQLIGLRLHPTRLEVEGEPTPIAREVDHSDAAGSLAASVSRTGDLLFLPDDPFLRSQVELVWLDRQGEATPAFDRRLDMFTSGFELSRRGSRFALGQPAGAQDDGEVHVGELDRGLLTQVTRGAGVVLSPLFSPDGEWVVFGSERTGDRELYRVRADGAAPMERIFRDDAMEVVPTDWPRENLLLVQASPKATGGGGEIWAIDLPTGTATKLLAEKGVDFEAARLSPDGRWLAFVADKGGRYELYVRSFPKLDREWRVSLAGGFEPHWRDDSRELAFLASDRSVQVAEVGDVEAGPGRPRPLFTAERLIQVTPASDHRRFLVARALSELERRSLYLILDAGPRIRGERGSR